MEILSTISSLLSIGELYVSLREALSIKPNRDTISAWFKELSELLIQINESLANGRYPHDKCAQVQFYLTAFHGMLKRDKNLDEKMSEMALNLIDDACRVEKLLGQLNHLNKEDKEYNHAKLLEAAGTFAGISDYIKLKR